MNSEPKISLTLMLEGSTCRETGEFIEGEFIIKNKDLIDGKKKPPKERDKIVKKGKYKRKKYEYIPASKHINICYDAYLYMISSECPHWFETKEGPRLKVWSKLTPAARLNKHMAAIASANHALTYSYSVLED